MEHSKFEQATRPARLWPLLMAITAIGPGALNIIAPALPGMIERLGTDAATVQLTLSLYLLGLAGAQLVLGPLSDRFGRRPVVLAGLVLSVAASIAAFAASSIGALIVARIVQAAGASTGVVVGRAIVRDLYDRDRAAGVIGLVTSAMVVAPMVAPLIGGLLDTAFGWEAIFVFTTAASAGVLLWAGLLLPETRHRNAPQAKTALWREWVTLLVNRKFYAYVSAGALGSATYFIFLGGGPHIVITLMGRSSAEYGLWFALSAFGYMSGNFTVSRLVQRFGLDTLIVAGIGCEFAGACLAALLFVLLPDGGPATVFLPQFIINFGNGLLLPNCIAGAISVRPEAAGSASGLSGFSQMAFGAGATQVISILLAGGTSPLPMAWAMLAMTIVAGISFKLLVRR